MFKTKLSLALIISTALAGCNDSQTTEVAVNPEPIKQVQRTAKKPNFVWILSEDNSPKYLQLYAKDGAKTPNIEALASEGLVFDNAFSNAPVCSVARSTLALGDYAPKTSAMHHRQFKAVPLQIHSIYQLMKDHGYYVTNAVKTDFNFAFNKDDLFSDLNIDATWRNRAKDQPFFHIRSTNETHESKIIFPISDLKEAPTTTKPESVTLAGIHPDTELFRYTHARTLDNHVKMDSQIGKVIADLKKDGLLEDTFVFYFGDHGGVLPGSKSFANNQGLRTPLVVRIPKNFAHLVDKSMQNAANTRVEGFVNFVDFAPTLLHLAGFEVPKYQDGTPFLGADISLAELNKRNYSFGYADRFGERYDMVRNIRVGNLSYGRSFFPFSPNGLQQDYRYKILAYQEWRELYKRGELTSEQAAFFKAKPIETLYDTSKDPDELHNLAYLPEYASKVADFRRKMNAQLKAMPDLGFISEYVVDLNHGNDALAYGQAHKAEITGLIDIANLALEPFVKNKVQLEKILANGTDNQKFWALNVLTTFGNQAIELSPQVKAVLNQNVSNLIKAKAIEFLAHTEQMDPVPAIIKLVEATNNKKLALEILNIATILHDVKGHKFDIKVPDEWTKKYKKADKVSEETILTNSSLIVRLKYLKN